MSQQSLCHVVRSQPHLNPRATASCMNESHLCHGCIEQRCASSQPHKLLQCKDTGFLGARALPHLLVAAQDVAYERRAREGLVDLHRGAPRVRKQLPHALALQRLHEDVGAFPRLAAVPIDPLFPPCPASAASGLVHPKLLSARSHTAAAFFCLP
jgi:hypothetical protein